VRTALARRQAAVLSLLGRRRQGWPLGHDDTVVLAKALKERGVDFFDCSCGGLEADRAWPRSASSAGYNVVYSEHGPPQAGIPTSCRQ